VRRARSEWILAPLFVLPLAGVVAFCLYIRADYRAELSEVRAGAPEHSFELGGAARAFARAVAHAEATARGTAEAVVERDGEPMRVRLRHRVPHRWVFRSGFAGGLTADAMADPQVRLDVETGVPPARLPALGERARVFRDLYDSPDLARLAAAPLPVESKLFLARRTPGGEAARPLLDALALAPAPPESPGARGPWLKVDGRPPVLWPSQPPLRLRWTEPERRRVRLLYSATPMEGPVPWRGGPKPLAGHWAVEAVHGSRWWRDGRFRRWMWPVAVAAAGLLLFPALAWLAMRRQRALDEARFRFLAEIAHDLRTPLTALRLQAELFDRDAPDEPRARRVAGEAAKLSRLLANLLDLTRLERGTRRFELEAVDVGRLVEETVRDFRAAHPERADDLTLEGGPLQARCDRTGLRRCLVNLLDNAGKHTSPGTPVRVAWTAADGLVRIDVADGGPGVDARDRAGLFRRYRRGGRARADAVPGTGLGLALVRELARGMGGSAVFVPSERGAHFRLEVPCS